MGTQSLFKGYISTARQGNRMHILEHSICWNILESKEKYLCVAFPVVAAGPGFVGVVGVVGAAAVAVAGAKIPRERRQVQPLLHKDTAGQYALKTWGYGMPRVFLCFIRLEQPLPFAHAARYKYFFN